VEPEYQLRGLNRQQSLPSSSTVAPKFNYIKPTASSTTRLKQQQQQQQHFQGLSSNSEDFIEHFSSVYSSSAGVHHNNSRSSIQYTPTNQNTKKGAEGFGPASNRNQINSMHVTPIASSGMRSKPSVVHPTQR
jgi:hypothetical protein